MTVFEATNTLLVPVELTALVVNGEFQGKDVRRWQMNFHQLLRHNNPEPEPFHGEIEDDFFSKAENHGVYLHWLVPLALRRGMETQDQGRQVEFPALPNRWVVLRQSSNRNYKKSWVIKSDALHQNTTGGSSFAYVENGIINVSRLGEAKALTESINPGNEESAFRKLGEHGFPKSLNALGYGDVNFLAYQPLMNDIFSFHDNLDDLKDNEKKLLPTDVFLNYLVAGWYSDDLDEILPKTDKEVLEMLEKLEWKVDGAGRPAEKEKLEKLRRSIYYGKLYRVKPGEAKHIGSDPGHSGFKVAFGNNAIDAMMAVIEQTSQNLDEEMFLFLKTFLYGELDLLHKAGGKDLLAHKIRKSWFNSRSAGFTWIIEKKENDKDKTDPLEDSTLVLLEELNGTQATKEQELRELKQLQKLLYDTWWQLSVKKNNTPQDPESQEKIEEAINDLDSRDVALAIREKKQLLNGIEGKIKETKKNLEKELKGTYRLSTKEAEPFWQTNDPTVLITGISPAAAFDTNEGLQCFLPERLNSSGISSEDHFVKNEVFQMLLKDFKKESETPPSPYVWKQPWNPLFIEWEVEWVALPFKFQDEQCWEYNNTDYHLTDKIKAEEFGNQGGHIIRGRNFLTPQNNYTFFHQLKELKKMTPPDKLAKLENLENFIKNFTAEKFLSQPLKDFNLQLTMHQTHLGLLPESLKELIGNECYSQPVTPGILPSYFEGIRQGQFKVNKLLVYDAFGQCLTLVGGRGIKNERNFLPIKDKNLLPKKDKTVFKWNTTRLMELKPRLHQHTRLKADFIDAGSDGVMEIHKDVNPICGWLIQNHLDKSLTYFDNSGHYLGETRALIDQVQTNISGIIPNVVLKDFIDRVPASVDEFERFRSLIDQTLLTIEPNATTQSQHMAVWMGRPLAIVRCRLRLECDEPVCKVDDDLESELPNHQNPAYLKEREQTFHDYKFNIEIGNQGLLQDGLIGFLKEGKFYSVVTGRQFQSAFIEPIQKDTLVVTYHDPVQLTLLMDPQASIFIGTGILPSVSAKLPAEFVSDCLNNLQVQFRFHSLLTTIRKAAQPEGFDDLTFLPPALQNGTWQWEEQQMGNQEMVRRFNVVTNPGEATLPDRPAVIRDGKLVLKIKKPKD